MNRPWEKYAVRFTNPGNDTHFYKHKNVTFFRSGTKVRRWLECYKLTSIRATFLAILWQCKLLSQHIIWWFVARRRHTDTDNISYLCAKFTQVKRSERSLRFCVQVMLLFFWRRVRCKETKPKCWIQLAIHARWNSTNRIRHNMSEWAIKYAMSWRKKLVTTA